MDVLNDLLKKINENYDYNDYDALFIVGDFNFWLQLNLEDLVYLVGKKKLSIDTLLHYDELSIFLRNDLLF